MKKEIKIKYSFEARAKELNKDSEELQAYARFFDENIYPEMVEIEKRKNKAVEEAYKIRVCSLKTSK